MIYRTAHRATYRSLNNNLGSLSYRIAQLTNQIASERRINTPSDDPSGAAKVLGTRSTLSNIEQYKTNIAVSELWLSDSGNAIQSIKETLDKIITLTEQGSTDTTGKQLSSIADDVMGYFETLLQHGNKKIGDSYIFGGQQVTSPAFATQVEAHKVINGCQNSSKWTGKVQNYGDPRFNNRPDLPVHSQDFLVEVVKPGGVDSRYYTKYLSAGTGWVSGKDKLGADYGLKFESLNKKYDNAEVKIVSGAENKTSIGDMANGPGFDFSGGTGPVNVNFVKGGTGGTTASWDSASQTLTVELQTDTSGVCVATGLDVDTEISAALAAASPPITPPITYTMAGSGTEVVQPGKATFNQGISVEVKGNEITVYLPRNNDPNGQGDFVATAQNIADAINAHPQAGQMVDASVTGGAGVAVMPTTSVVKLSTAHTYTLAHATVDPKGTQNGLLWSVKNKPDYIDPVSGQLITGAAGNNFTVEYRVPENPFTATPSIDYTHDPAPPPDGTRKIVVNAAVDQEVYERIFSQVYTDPESGAFLDHDKANEIALREAITTTANDVRDMVNSHPDLKNIIDVSLADGNSGEGKINVVHQTKLTDGYDEPALFRVSQDGGKTWGPPMSFGASEYMTGDMFYNAYLGHASYTTNLRGSANDLVFTAKQMGTWGNDLRVEYKDPAKPNQAASVTVGPNPWNICVTLGTDAQGNITTTANEIKDLINKHPEASQMVLADLANYHEGGTGIVRPMECKSLSVGEPYQIDGKSVITPLGHSTANVSFPYTAAAQKCPNIIFQALEQGPDGDDIGIRYTTSADPTYFSSASAANDGYQDHTSVRYEKTADGKTVVVVHLATSAIPSCPDPETDREASDKWKELYPLYSCTEDRAVLTTAGSVIQAIIDLNTADPANAVVWPSMERWPDGWDATAKVGPTDGTIWLTGGNETDDASNHGVNLKFIPDGSSLQVGDIFEVPVGWYKGDDKNIDINAGANYQTTMNTTGNKLYGGNGQDGNILDTVQRLIWALQQEDTELVAKELPKLRDAIEQVTTLETKIGTKQIRNEFILQNLETSKLSAQNLLSQIEDADFSQLITDLKNAQTVYEACLGATGLTNKLSLLNYI